MYPNRCAFDFARAKRRFCVISGIYVSIFTFVSVKEGGGSIVQRVYSCFGRLVL